MKRFYRGARGALLLMLLAALLPHSLLALQSAPDPGVFAYLGKDGNIWVASTAGGDARQITHDATGDAIAYEFQQWSADGGLLLFRRGRIELQEQGRFMLPTLVEATEWTAAADGSEIRARRPQDAGKLSPDGRYAAYVVRQESGRQLFVRDLSTGAERLVAEAKELEGPWFNPATGAIAFWAEADTGERALYFARNDGTDPQPVAERPGRCGEFTPDGKTFIYASGAVTYRAAQVYRLDVSDLLDSQLTTYSGSFDIGVLGCPWLAADGEHIQFAKGVPDSTGVELVTVTWSGEVISSILLRVEDADLFPDGVLVKILGLVLPTLDRSHVIMTSYTGGSISATVVFNVATGQATQIGWLDFAESGGFHEQMLSPDGQRLLLSRPDGIWQEPIDGSTPPVKIAEGSAPLWQPAPRLGAAADQPAGSTPALLPPAINFPATDQGALPAASFTGEMRGTAAPNVTVRVYRSSTQPDAQTAAGDGLATTQSDASGNWSVSHLDVSAGDNFFVAVAEADGQVSELSNVLQIVRGAPTDSGAEDASAPAGSASSESFAHCYGFKYGDGVDTREGAEEATELLRTLGYLTSYQENAHAKAAYDLLPKDSIFYFHGHGWNEGLLFSYNPLEAIRGQYLHDTELPRLRLAVLNGCEGGQDLSRSDNVMSSFLSAGADTVIGFDHAVDTVQADHWGEIFWATAAAGVSVGDAAYFAADLVSGDWRYPLLWLQHHEIDANAVVILGDSALKITEKD